MPKVLMVLTSHEQLGSTGRTTGFFVGEAAHPYARQVWEAGGAVSAVCHGPAGLVNLKLSDGAYLVAGRTVAAFTDDEERAAGLDEEMPFLLASTLVERGAHHTTAPNFEPNVEVDGQLVTGQNPASAAPLAEALVEVIKARRPAGTTA